MAPILLGVLPAWYRELVKLLSFPAEAGPVKIHEICNSFSECVLHRGQHTEDYRLECASGL